MLKGSLLGQNTLSGRLRCQNNLVANLLEQVGNGNARIESNTTEGWSSQTTYVPKKDSIIIYTDYKTIVQDGVTKLVAGIKIGDGNAYVVDLPFIDDELRELLTTHINDTNVHIQEGERNFWNNKLNYYLDGEILEFNRN